MVSNPVRERRRPRGVRWRYTVKLAWLSPYEAILG